MPQSRRLIIEGSEYMRLRNCTALSGFLELRGTAHMTFATEVVVARAGCIPTVTISVPHSLVSWAVIPGFIVVTKAKSLPARTRVVLWSLLVVASFWRRPSWYQPRIDRCSVLSSSSCSFRPFQLPKVLYHDFSEDLEGRMSCKPRDLTTDRSPSYASFDTNYDSNEIKFTIFEISGCRIFAYM